MKTNIKFAAVNNNVLLSLAKYNCNTVKKHCKMFDELLKECANYVQKAGSSF